MFSIYLMFSMFVIVNSAMDHTMDHLLRLVNILQKYKKSLLFTRAYILVCFLYSVPPSANVSSISVPNETELLRWTNRSNKTSPRAPTLRSMFRNVYFTYQHYRPEVQFGMCVMRIAVPKQFKIIDDLDNSSAKNASNYVRSVYNQLSTSIGEALDTMPCDDSPTASGQQTKCARMDPLGDRADGSMDVYRIIWLNMAEKWLRSVRVLRPLMASISSVNLRLVGQFVSSVLDRHMELLSDLFMPGLYGCSQSYLHKWMWRTLESWI